MGEVVDITSESEWSAHLDNTSPLTVLVLYYFTPWTVFKHDLLPNLTTLVSQYPSQSPAVVHLARINGKAVPELAKQHHVPKAPTVVIFRAGQILESISGGDDIVERVHRALDAYTRYSTPGIKPPDATTTTIELTPELTARLENLTKKAPVVIFMKGSPDAPRCRFSRRLVGLLREQGIAFDFFDVMTDEDVRQGLKQIGDWPTYPQLWVDGKLVGGLEIVREMLDIDTPQKRNDEVGDDDWALERLQSLKRCVVPAAAS